MPVADTYQGVRAELEEAMKKDAKLGTIVLASLKSLKSGMNWIDLDRSARAHALVYHFDVLFGRYQDIAFSSALPGEVVLLLDTMLHRTVCFTSWKAWDIAEKIEHDCQNSRA
eukprot:2840554-Karenia_brevis.AAC.1